MNTFYIGTMIRVEVGHGMDGIPTAANSVVFYTDKVVGHVQSFRCVVSIDASYYEIEMLDPRETNLDDDERDFMYDFIDELGAQNVVVKLNSILESIHPDEMSLAPAKLQPKERTINEVGKLALGCLGIVGLLAIGSNKKSKVQQKHEDNILTENARK